MQTEFTRFSRLVDKTPTCWLWKGATYRHGYGHFRRKIGGVWVMYKAHRYAYEYYKGEIPKGLIIRHVCDNPRCVNPDHLMAGTHKENVHDMMTRGRKVIGINPNHKSHKELAPLIRAFKTSNPAVSGKELAKLFNTSTAQVSRILNHRIWNIPEEVL